MRNLGAILQFFWNLFSSGSGKIRSGNSVSSTTTKTLENQTSERQQPNGGLLMNLAGGSEGVERECGKSMDNEEADQKVPIFIDIRRYYCEFCGICRSKKALIASHILDHHKVSIPFY